MYGCETTTAVQKSGDTMKLDLRALLAGECRTFPVLFDLEVKKDAKNHFSGLTDIRFDTPLHVEGTITNTAGYIRMLLTLSVSYTAPCARCLEDVSGSFSFDVERTVVPAALAEDLTEDRIDELVVVEDGFLSLDELLTECLELSLPFRFLCREDCKGLCPKCGKNLNDGPCDCVEKEVDPRLEPLRRLLEEMKAEESQSGTTQVSNKNKK